MLACNINIALSCSTGVHLGIVNKQSVIFDFNLFLKKTSKMDIRLEISVVSTCVNLN